MSKQKKGKLTIFALGGVGVAVGAGLVTIFTIGADAAPAGRLATTMTLLSSGIIIGQGIAVALVGNLADAAGAVAALSAVAVPAGLGLVLAAVHLVLVRARRRPAPEGEAASR